MEWTKVSNGHTLTIKMDTETLINKLDKRILEFKREMLDIAADKVGDDDGRCYERSAVYGNAEYDFVEPSECIKDLEEMKNTINNLATGEEIDSLWSNIALKKNGTFKRNCKLIIREECFGYYWEDSYGWNTEVLRVEPDTDTVVNIVLTNIVIHY